jgi:succinate dehydrogenase / fumarate reductase, cytochrome b subunit
MSEAAAAVRSPAVEKDHSFLLRKLHSLSGIAPIGGYMAFHLFENMKAAAGAESYNEMVKGIWGMAPRPVFYMIELGVLIIPILFHSLYGFYIWYSGQSNATQYGYRRNWMYTLQRWSGLIAFAYLVYHVYTLRIAPGLLRGQTQLTTFEDVRGQVGTMVGTAIYLVGNLACAFHLGNGLFGFCYSWGLAVGRKAQQAVELIGWGVTLGLSAMSIYVVVALQ